MKARRILMVGFCFVVLVLLLLPYLFVQWKRHGNANSVRNEPIYNGKPLHEWAMDTQDEAITGGPSPLAIEANQALQAIGPSAIPWLIRWIKPPMTDSRMPGGAVYALKALGSQATSAIPELVKILNKPVVSLNDQSSQISAAEALSYLGPDAIPFMLTAATNHLDPEIQSELIQNFGNLGTNGVAAIPALIAWAADKNTSVRVGAVIALGATASGFHRCSPCSAR